MVHTALAIPKKLLGIAKLCCKNTGDDVDENPGPTIFDIIDPTTTVSADSSQGNGAIFGVNAGKECVAMSHTAMIYHQIQDISLWTNSTLNNILVIGNNL